MLFNRVFSLSVLLSITGCALAAPLPRPQPLEADALKNEVEVEQEGKTYELEWENKQPSSEVEVKAKNPTAGARRTRLARSDSPRTMTAAVADAQAQLDKYSAKILEDVQGPLGSIEPKSGEDFTSVSDVIDALYKDMQSHIEGKDDTTYFETNGDGTTTELADACSTMLVTISGIEDMIKNVSGFKVTSAQLKIKNNLLGIKKMMNDLLPKVYSRVATNMSRALSVGGGPSPLV